MWHEYIQYSFLWTIFTGCSILHRLSLFATVLIPRAKPSNWFTRFVLHGTFNSVTTVCYCVLVFESSSRLRRDWSVSSFERTRRFRMCWKLWQRLASPTTFHLVSSLLLIARKYTSGDVCVFTFLSVYTHFRCSNYVDLFQTLICDTQSWLYS